MRPVVVAEFPHDPEAFTQGLLLHDGWFYESTGLRGRSTVRRVEPTTGRVDTVVALPDSDFGEGLARVDERLIQLTWQENIAYVYDLSTLTEVARFEYGGEGWGLCFDGTRLVMSDGSSSLFFRDADSFEQLGVVTVTRDGAPVDRLNELECVDGLVFANVWQTDEIVRIDPETGQVLTRIDASGLLSAEEARLADVLNGIAHDPVSGNFFITGKLWPRLFEVRLDVEVAEPDPSPPASNVPDAGEVPDAAVEPPGTHTPAGDPRPPPLSDPTVPGEPNVEPAPSGSGAAERRGADCACRTTGPAPPLALGGALLLCLGLARRRTHRH